MNEILSKFLQIKDDVLMRFHAVRSDADGLGNDIVATYARKSALEPIKEQIDLQREVIVETADEVEALQHDLKNTESSVDGVRNKQKTDEDVIADLKAKLEEAEVHIGVLEDEVKLKNKDKGLFETEKAVNEISPLIGDSAIVLAPTTTTPNDPEAYFGATYVGAKESHLGDWASNYNSALGKVYKVSNSLYRVELDVPFSMLVDSHHTELQLIEDGIISLVILTDKAYPYVCEEDGKWKRVNRNLGNISVSENTTTDKVKDGTLTQKEINLTARANSIVGNNNTSAIVATIYDLVDVVNDLQKNVAFIGEMEYKQIDKPSTTGYQVTGDLQKNLLDISPMPIILS